MLKLIKGTFHDAMRQAHRLTEEYTVAFVLAAEQEPRGAIAVRGIGGNPRATCEPWHPLAVVGKDGGVGFVGELPFHCMDCQKPIQWFDLEARSDG